MPKRFIIAALASRAYVEAAVAAGNEVIALDAFADADTQRVALECRRIPMTEKGFDAETLLACLDEIALETVDGFCYGAGFERQPELLEAVSARVKLLGNTAETVRLGKSPTHFATLCERLGMLHPAVSLAPPRNPAEWLYKAIGGSGGAHIQPGAIQGSGGYYQQYCAGEPISCLFAVVNGAVQIVGFNAQWCSPTDTLPYRFGGAVSQIELPHEIRTKIATFVAGLVDALELRGINSVDFILAENALYALELNPRLSASLALYRAVSGNLWDWHTDDARPLFFDQDARALNVIYADTPVRIEANWQWPEWVSDIPIPGTVIETGMPVCTVNAQAESAEQAKQLVLERGLAIQNWLYRENNNFRNGELACNNK